MSTPAPTPGSEGGRRRVEEALRRQRERDLLGPEGAERARIHSLGFAEAVGDPASPPRVLDLGSGGGVPGLVLAAEAWTTSEVVLLDGSRRRCTALEVEVDALGLGDRVRVVWSRAEEAGRDPDLRASFDVVVARSFASPAVTAECAAPLLRVGGVLVVSEPPDDGIDRWPAGVARLGLEAEPVIEAAGHRFVLLRQVEACPDRYPRRPGVPQRRPLF